MRLVVKFNLVLCAVFGVGLASAGLIGRALLQRGARDEVVQDARLIMESALASRSYTNTQIAPILQHQLEAEFLPHALAGFIGPIAKILVQKASASGGSYRELCLRVSERLATPQERARFLAQVDAA